MGSWVQIPYGSKLGSQAVISSLGRWGGGGGGGRIPTWYMMQKLEVAMMTKPEKPPRLDAQ